MGLKKALVEGREGRRQGSGLSGADPAAWGWQRKGGGKVTRWRVESDGPTGYQLRNTGEVMMALQQRPGLEIESCESRVGDDHGGEKERMQCWEVPPTHIGGGSRVRAILQNPGRSFWEERPLLLYPSGFSASSLICHPAGCATGGLGWASNNPK